MKKLLFFLCLVALFSCEKPADNNCWFCELFWIRKNYEPSPVPGYGGKYCDMTYYEKIMFEERQSFPEEPKQDTLKMKCYKEF